MSNTIEMRIASRLKNTEFNAAFHKYLHYTLCSRLYSFGVVSANCRKEFAEILTVADAYCL